jgi:hypothetical protein
MSRTLIAAVVLIVGGMAWLAVRLVGRRPPSMGDMGAVSTSWITSHRATTSDDHR